MTRTSGSALAALFLCICGLAASVPVRSADGTLALLMFDADDCPYCKQWETEVGVVYPRTAEGRLAPLQRRPLHDADALSASLSKPVRFTPTFVLLRDGLEAGRITGYPGEAHFWGLLGELLETAVSR